MYIYILNWYANYINHVVSKEAINLFFKVFYIFNLVKDWLICAKGGCYEWRMHWFIAHFTALVTCTCDIDLFWFEMEIFNNRPGFCPSCGSILPPLQVKGNVFCYNCKQEFSPDGKIRIETECCEVSIQIMSISQFTSGRHPNIQYTSTASILEKFPKK